MTNYPEDRRYESYEQRAAYDSRYVVDPRNINSKRAREAAVREADYVHYVAMAEARKAARAAAPDSPEHDKAVAVFAYHAEQRRDIHARIAAYDAKAQA